MSASAIISTPYLEDLEIQRWRDEKLSVPFEWNSTVSSMSIIARLGCVGIDTVAEVVVVW